MNYFSSESKGCNCSNVQVSKLSGPASPAKKVAGTLPSILLSVLIAVFPKCPFCWAAYMSMFSSIGLARLPYMKWLLPVLIIFLGVHLFVLYKKAAKNGYLPFVLSFAGAAAMIVGKTFFLTESWLLLAAMLLIVTGSLLNSFSNFKINFRSN